MAENISRLVETDMVGIPERSVTAPTERDRVLKILAHAYLRLWTRLALESGQKLKMSPSQYVLGNYEGQMHWTLNENVDYKNVAHIEIGATFRKKHALIAETYIMKGEERARLFFSLEQEKVKDRSVFVNYLVYDTPLTEFDVAKALSALKPILTGWIETITSGEDEKLWAVCKEQLECVGV